MKKPFYARHYLLIMLAAVFLLPLISRGARYAIRGNNNDVKDWLPESYAESADLKWFQSHFAGEQFALVSWDGCTLGHTEKLALLAEKLTAKSPVDSTGDEVAAADLFADVTTGPGVLDQLTAAPLSLDYDEAIERLEGSLVGPEQDGGGHASRTTCLVVTLSEEGKKNNLNKRRAIDVIRETAVRECAIPAEALHMGGPPVDNVSIDIEGERTLIRLASLSGIVGVIISYWCFRSVVLTAMVFAVGVLSAGLSLAVVHYFGLVERLSLGLETARFGSVDAILMSMPAVVYVLGLSGAIHIINYYRDAQRSTGLAGAPEQAIRHGWLPCTLAAITTALGLLSLYTSDIIPIRKFGVFSAIGVIGTLSMLFTILPACLYRFPPKLPRGRRESAENQQDAHLHPFARAFASLIIRRNGLVCVGMLAVMAVFAMGVAKIDTTVQLLKLFDKNADIIHDYRWLETHLGELVPMEVVLRVPRTLTREADEHPEENGEHYRLSMLQRMEMVERIGRRIEQLDNVGRALSAANFAPLPSQRRKSVAEHVIPVRTRFAINRRLEKHKDQLLAGDYLAEEVTAAGPGDDRGPRQTATELWRISARVDALGDVDYGQFVAEIRRVVSPVLETYRERDEIVRALAAAGKKLDASRICIVHADERTAAQGGSEGDAAALLATLLREAGVQLRGIGLSQFAADPSGRRHVSVDQAKALVDSRIDCLVVTADHAQLDWTDASADGLPLLVHVPGDASLATPSVTAKYTGVVPLVYKTQRQLLISLRQSIGWAFALIALVMMGVLRSPIAGLISMIPNVFPVVMIFGALGWLGIKVDIGTMMTASVALGVAVDDTVHFLFWFQRGMREGRSRHAATMLAYERCARAMFQTTVIGGLGLAVFAFSTFTPTQQFGMLMILLLSAALVGDLILLPAILAGPVGKFFGARLTAGVRPVEEEEASLHPHAGPPRQMRKDSPHRSVRL